MRLTEDSPAKAEAEIEIMLAPARRVRLRGRVDRQALADMRAVLAEESSRGRAGQDGVGASAEQDEMRLAMPVVTKRLAVATRRIAAAARHSATVTATSLRGRRGHAEAAEPGRTRCRSGRPHLPLHRPDGQALAYIRLLYDVADQARQQFERQREVAGQGGPVTRTAGL